jgi:hypothetical protein
MRVPRGARAEQRVALFRTVGRGPVERATDLLARHEKSDLVVFTCRRHEMRHE